MGATQKIMKTVHQKFQTDTAKCVLSADIQAVLNHILTLQIYCSINTFIGYAFWKDRKSTCGRNYCSAETIEYQCIVASTDILCSNPKINKHKMSKCKDKSKALTGIMS